MLRAARHLSGRIPSYAVSLRHQCSSTAHTRVYSSKPAPPDVRKLAGMAQIAVTDQEAEEWQGKIEAIVGWFDQLQDIDMSEQESPSHINAEGSRLRKDEPRAYENREGVLDAVPRRQNGYVKVPKIL